jgi:hypothetical protein
MAHEAQARQADRPRQRPHPVRVLVPPMIETDSVVPWSMPTILLTNSNR